MYERCSDPSDEASLREFSEIESALSAHRAALRRTEDPDEDESGNRYCLSCGDMIPQERVRLVDAVRCVVCAGKMERMVRMGRQIGGANRVRLSPDFPEAASGPTDPVALGDIDDEE